MRIKPKKGPVFSYKHALLGIKTAKNRVNTHFGQNEYSAHMYAHSKAPAVTAGALCLFIAVVPTAMGNVDPPVLHMVDQAVFFVDAAAEFSL